MLSDWLITSHVTYITSSDWLLTKSLTGFLTLYYGYERLCLIDSLNINKLFIVIKGIPFVIPSLLSIFCMCVQTYHLILRSRVARQSTISRRITITILYLTLTFVFCNIPDFVINLVILGAIRIRDSDISIFMCMVFVSGVILPYINSLLNPLILICRGSTLRAFAAGQVPCRSSEDGGVTGLTSRVLDRQLHPTAVIREHEMVRLNSNK